MPVLATIRLPSTTNVPANDVTIDIAITGSASDVAANGAAVEDALMNLLNDQATGLPGESIAKRISPVISRTVNCEVSLFDITGHEDGSPHGSPFYRAARHNLGPVASGATAVPSEVAVVATLETAARGVVATEAVNIVAGPDEPATYRPKSRNTGRVYIGPLSTEAIEIVSGTARVKQNFRQIITTKFRDLNIAFQALGAQNPHRVGVWSRADAIVREAAWVSVDNAFDTQRRRGEKASLRDRSSILI